MKQLKARVVSDGTPMGTKVTVGRENQDPTDWEELAVTAVGFQIDTESVGWVDLRVRVASVDLTGNLGALFTSDTVILDKRYANDNYEGYETDEPTPEPGT